MKKVLFLPFLQIKTGHHHVAEALTEHINQINPNVKCSTREILNDRFGNLELVVSKTYLQWIHHFPQSYNWIYQKVVCNEQSQDSRYYFYEFLFLNKMKKIIEEEQPDYIVCTHALPSYILDRLKQSGKISIPVINVYTDFFVHNLWGTNHIDFHFVSTENMKQYLIDKKVNPAKIFLTGIPIHPNFEKGTRRTKQQSALNVLVAGGSLGVGFCEEIVDQLTNENVNYYILCGKNKDLFERISKLNKHNLIPLPYIESKEKMSQLYDNMDAMITKPGGVTLSECIYKHLPIFVYDALPGQEQINLKELKKLGLIFYSKEWKRKKNIEKDLLHIVTNQRVLEEYNWKVSKYNNKVINDHYTSIISNIIQAKQSHKAQL